MEQLKHLLQEHYAAHPAMTVRDGAKFLHQHHMGPGHLIPDEGVGLARLEEEWRQFPPDPDAPLFEELGNDLCRLNLAGCKARGLSLAIVHRLFTATARDISPDPSGLEQTLDLLYTLPFEGDAVDSFLAEYRASGCPMVHHSPEYRAAYSPAYRVVRRSWLRLIPVVQAIENRMAAYPNVRVAIDGPCASGKSTLGDTLSRLYRCPLLHMDDFFLRPEQRTPEQLAEPGGNVDHARFQEEFLLPLTHGEAAHYRPWRCHSGDFGPEVTVFPSPVTIVEGSYSLRPDLREAYHLRIWVEATWQARKERILGRGGPGCLARFKELWIPMEDRYFSACKVRECCHLTVSGEV